jgi:hypothetical protein
MVQATRFFAIADEHLTIPASRERSEQHLGLSPGPRAHAGGHDRDADLRTAAWPEPGVRRGWIGNTQPPGARDPGRDMPQAGGASHLFTCTNARVHPLDRALERHLFGIAHVMRAHAVHRAPLWCVHGRVIPTSRPGLFGTASARGLCCAHSAVPCGYFSTGTGSSQRTTTGSAATELARHTSSPRPGEEAHSPCSLFRSAYACLCTPPAPAGRSRRPDRGPGTRRADALRTVAHLVIQTEQRVWHRTPAWCPGVFLTCGIPQGILSCSLLPKSANRELSTFGCRNFSVKLAEKASKTTHQCFFKLQNGGRQGQKTRGEARFYGNKSSQEISAFFCGQESWSIEKSKSRQSPTSCDIFIWIKYIGGYDRAPTL